MERNENGIPRTSQNATGRNAAADFFKEQNLNTAQNGGCRNLNSEGDKNGAQMHQNLDTGMDICSDSLPLAYAYVPWQKWRLLYTPENALANGTLFEELNKPLGVYGNE